MELKDFDFPLPAELIAQYPLEERDSSRLMVLGRRDASVSHRSFKDIREYLKKGDVLVLNNTRVMRARLIGKRQGGKKTELFLVEKTAGDGREVWECLLKPSKGMSPGARIRLDGGMEAEIIEKTPRGLWACELRAPGPFDEMLERIGRVPLPPYIKREPSQADAHRYQTVFAGVKGAVAAPTAGLHFTHGLLEEIKGMGVEVFYLTLHTGPGTFMPVRVNDIKGHRMMGERYSIGREAHAAVTRAKKENRRVIAVGTTTTRALEASVLKGFEKPVLEGSTELFIYPGFEFRVIDGLLTNFHLPGSTLIMLASAFAGREFLMEAYKKAVQERYRFFSYGDAMLIV